MRRYQTILAIAFIAVGVFSFAWRISAQDANGNELFRDNFLLAAGARATIMLPDAYKLLAGTSGKLRVVGDTNRLSAIVFRISPAGNMAYSPIFNWSGMFQ